MIYKFEGDFEGVFEGDFDCQVEGKFDGAKSKWPSKSIRRRIRWGHFEVAFEISSKADSKAIS